MKEANLKIYLKNFEDLMYFLKAIIYIPKDKNSHRYFNYSKSAKISQKDPKRTPHHPLSHISHLTH